MSLHLIQTLEAAFSQLAQEVKRGETVVVQFAADDWAKIKEALDMAKAEVEPASVAPAVEPVQEPVSSPEPEPVDSEPESEPQLETTVPDELPPFNPT